MLTTSQKEVSLDRMKMALVGAAAGVSLWLFVDILPDVINNARLLMFLSAFVMGFFIIMMALTGPAKIGISALCAAALALPSAALFTWASLRFVQIETFLATGHMITSIVVLMGISTPFIAAALQEKSGWKRYALLFDISWIIVVRYAASWLFVAVFWGVLMLSNALLEIVGITVIEDLLRIDWVPFVLTGAVLGLALSVVHELSEYVSPFLILRLLRLLLPIVLAVVATFIIALPLRGLSNLFGNLSSATTLMGMAWAGITLVTTALDKSDDNAVANTPMQIMTKALALLLPILAALSLYAIWLRIHQYGLTPNRIAAGFLGLFILGYSSTYVLSILRRHNWMADIRNANRIMAMALVAVSIAWMTPLFNVERLATNTQIARFEAGKTGVANLALWEMAHEWGIAGKAGLEKLRNLQDHPEKTALLTRLDLAVATPSKYSFHRTTSTTQTANIADDLFKQIVVKPEGQTLPANVFEASARRHINQLQAGCARSLPDGRKACVAIVAPFNPALDRPQGVFLYLETRNRVAAIPFGVKSKTTILGGAMKALETGNYVTLPIEVLIDALDGNFTLEPANIQALHIGGLALIADN